MARPRQSALTKEQVVRAAVRLADQGGVATMSMRKLAAEVGVEAMSLYHYLANKDELLDAIVDVVFGEIEVPADESDWQQAMRLRAQSAREALTRHRWALGLMDSRTTPGPATLHHHDAVLGCLRRAGFSLPGAAQAFALLDSYIYGFVLQELSLPFETSDEAVQLADDILQQMPADEYPHLAELAVGHVMQPGYSYSDEFLPSLDLVLDGLESVRIRG